MSVFVSTRAAQKRVPWKTATTCCSARLYLKRNQEGFLSSFLFFFLKLNRRDVSVLLLEKYRDYNQSIPFSQRDPRECARRIIRLQLEFFAFEKIILQRICKTAIYIYMYIKTDTITDFVSFYFLFFFFSSPPFFLFW